MGINSNVLLQSDAHTKWPAYTKHNSGFRAVCGGKKKK